MHMMDGSQTLNLGGNKFALTDFDSVSWPDSREMNYVG